jgi:tRNA A58 N-methylase Trm61
MSGVFAEGEKALFIDSKQRRYLIQLNAEGEFHSHAVLFGASISVGNAASNSVYANAMVSPLKR